MKITKEEVLRVASLSKLKFTDDEAETLKTAMSDVIGFADQLSELDTEGVIPTAHAIPMQNAFREDEIKPSLTREEILKNAPEADEEGFIVPKVLE